MICTVVRPSADWTWLLLNFCTKPTYNTGVIMTLTPALSVSDSFFLPLFLSFTLIYMTFLMLGNLQSSPSWYFVSSHLWEGGQSYSHSRSRTSSERREGSSRDSNSSPRIPHLMLCPCQQSSFAKCKTKMGCKKVRRPAAPYSAFAFRPWEARSEAAERKRRLE